MEELGIILKKLREKKGITQQELVKLSGVGQGTIGDIERGKIKKSKLETLEKLAKALKLDELEREELFSVLVPKDIKNKVLNKNNNIILENEVILKEKVDSLKAYEDFYNLIFKDLTLEEKKEMLNVIMDKVKLLAIEKNKYDEAKEKIELLKDKIQGLK